MYFPEPPTRRRITDAAILAVGAVLCATAAATTAEGSAVEHPWLEALARAFTVGAPIAVGVYARRHPSTARFGTLLVATGAAWFLTTLAETADPVWHAVGRISGWLIEPLLVFLVLSFPTGRLTARPDRVLFGIVVTTAVTLYLPSALLIDRFPEPSPWATCSGGCPHNPLMLLGSEPAWVDDVLRPARELLTVLLFAAVSVRLAQRLIHSSRLMRRTLAPVLVVAAMHFACFAVVLAGRRFDPTAEWVTATMWTLSLTVPLMAAGFLVGIARWHLFIAAAIQGLAGRLVAHHASPVELQYALADTFEDPDLEIIYPLEDGRWADDSGAAVVPPSNGSLRSLTVIEDEGRVVAGIVHDGTLADEEGFVDASRAYAILTLDNRRLGAQAAALLEEVHASRSRIQASADDERRRVERDLHDGAQQRLVALRIKLELAAERIDGRDHRSAAVIRSLGTEVDNALDEIRSLARGIYPSPLADRGLVEGLRSAAMQAVLPAQVHANNARKRYPPEVESAAYFCCLEAMQNAAKHAHEARSLVIEIHDNGVLQFEVRDDGVGFDTERVVAGFGLTSMRDRLAAVSGELHIVSSEEGGTRVIGRIPLDRKLPRFLPAQRKNARYR